MPTLLQWKILLVFVVSSLICSVQQQNLEAQPHSLVVLIAVSSLSTIKKSCFYQNTISELSEFQHKISKNLPNLKQ